MKRSHKIAIAVFLVLSVVAVGGAIGATQLTPGQERDAVINDAAEQLGVDPSELSNALEQALKNRVDEAVEDGRLTEEQGNRMKERIDAGGVPFLGVPGFHRHRGPHLFHAKLEAAAEYLGMTQAELRRALADGKTLAQVARDRDKSVDGLVDALVQDAERKLEDVVEAGRLTESQKDEMLEGLRERITSMVNNRRPRLMPAPGFRRIEPGAYFRPEPSF